MILGLVLAVVAILLLPVMIVMHKRNEKRRYFYRILANDLGFRFVAGYGLLWKAWPFVTGTQDGFTLLIRSDEGNPGSIPDGFGENMPMTRIQLQVSKFNQFQFNLGISQRPAKAATTISFDAYFQTKNNLGVTLDQLPASLKEKLSAYLLRYRHLVISTAENNLLEMIVHGELDREKRYMQVMESMAILKELAATLST